MCIRDSLMSGFHSSFYNQQNSCARHHDSAQRIEERGSNAAGFWQLHALVVNHHCCQRTPGRLRCKGKLSRRRIAGQRRKGCIVFRCHSKFYRRNGVVSLRCLGFRQPVIPVIQAGKCKSRESPAGSQYCNCLPCILRFPFNFLLQRKFRAGQGFLPVIYLIDNDFICENNYRCV